jgi:hypothetical protein
MRVGIYTRCKDEDNLIEFMEHYYSIGFNFILIYDDSSIPPIKDVLHDKFTNKYEIIDISKFPNSTPQETSRRHNDGNFFVEYILPKIQKYMDYCLYVDIDEYLVLKNFINIKEVIEYYQPFDQLKINWILFGNNYIKNAEHKRDRLIPTFKRSAQYCNIHVKCLTRVNKINTARNPHFFLTFHGKNKNILNETTNESPFEEKLVNYRGEDIPIYIAHYIVQGTYSFVKRRFCRYTANVGALMDTYNLGSITDVLKYFNDNIDIIVDFMHGDRDDGILPQYKLAIESIRQGFFNSHNCNEIENSDLMHM